MPPMYEPVLHVVLYEPEIPFNAGSVGRTCVAAGAKLWLVRPLGFQVEDRRLKRAGLDYWPRLVWEVVDDWQALAERLAGHRFWFLSKTARTAYTEARFQPGDVLVFGPESRGLPPSMLDENADRALRVPIRDAVRSLNLTVTVGVVAYEALRQIGMMNEE